jgi:hypothetical protein|tara:strand:- start:63 stop:677 length:615 start_codon:yes stop_codon:yes gene_type:complete
MTNKQINDGDEVIVKGFITKVGDNTKPKSNDDIYASEEKNVAIDIEKYNAAATETVSQASQSGLQTLVSHVQSQVTNIGMSGVIAVGSGGAFQIEHMHDQISKAHEIATPMVAELVETGTISKETIAAVLPADSKFQGQELPVAETVLGKPVGEYKKQVDAEKNKSDEQKAIEEAFRKSVTPPSPSDEKDGSMTSIEEQDKTMT